MKQKVLSFIAALGAIVLILGAASVNKTGVFYDLNLGATTNKISDDGAQITYNGNPVVSTTFVTNKYTFTTNIFENSYVLYTNTFLEYYITTNTYNSVTNYFTDVFNWSTNTYYSFYSYTNIYNGGKITYNNSTIIYTNTSVTFNGTNIATINPTDGVIPVRVGTNYFGDSPLSVANNSVYLEYNLGVTNFPAGQATFIDLKRATVTNSVSGAVSLAYATNGIDGVNYTATAWYFNGSGSDQTLSIPSGWRTNMNSAVPPSLTNGTITVIYLKSMGATDSDAHQTNCYVSFEYYK